MARLNGEDVTALFHPATPVGDGPEAAEIVLLPLRPGQNRLVLQVKGVRDGRSITDVDTFGFWVGTPPAGPR